MDNRVLTPPGELIPVNGSAYHVRRFGEHGPVVLLECGLTMMSACWGWLAPELSSYTRVIAYDRAGLGWSEPRAGLRDAAQLASELNELLGALQVKEPVILLGHSMGAIITRALLSVAAEPVRALVWLDPAHPEQAKRRGIRRKMRNIIFYIEAAQFLARRNVPAIEVPLARHLDSLPAEDFNALRRFLRSPGHLRTSAREARAWELATKLPDAPGLAASPILTISAGKNSLPGWPELQHELASLSSNSQHITFPEMSHISMLAQREHAAKVAWEIRGFVARLPL